LFKFSRELINRSIKTDFSKQRNYRTKFLSNLSKPKGSDSEIGIRLICEPKEKCTEHSFKDRQVKFGSKIPINCNSWDDVINQLGVVDSKQFQFCIESKRNISDYGCSNYSKKGQITIPINREGTYEKLPSGDYSVYAAYRGNKQDFFAPDVTLDVMPGIDFQNHSCWDFKTLVVEGGMWIECTGTNLPKAGDEAYYMVEIKDFKKGFDDNANCPSGTQNKWEVFNCEEKRVQFFDGRRIRFLTPFLNACKGCDQLNGKIRSDEFLEENKHCSYKADGLGQIQFNLFKSKTNCSAKYCKAKSLKSNNEIDEKDQCWVGDDKFQITKSPFPNGIQTVKNSDFGLLQNPVYKSEGDYIAMQFYFTTDGTNRYERYFKSLGDVFRLEVYRHKHEEERHHRIDQAHINQIKRKWPKTSMVVVEPEKVKGQDRLLPSVKVIYPNSEIEWNRFDTQICLGEYHKDSCSKTGQIIKVDYAKFGLYAGVPLFAVILIIILVCVCMRKQKREKKLKHALSVNETKQNELKELMGCQKPAKDKFDEYCLMLEHQYNPKTEARQFNANKKLVQSIRGMYIDYEDVDKSNLELGSGAFGVAFKGRYQRMDVVFKLCKPPVPQAPSNTSQNSGYQGSNGYHGKLDADMTTELFKEAAVMKSFEHQNVLKLHGVTLDTVYSPGLITTYMNKGDLRKFLRNSENQFSYKQCIKFGLNAASGMEYLHQKNVIHRDLAARNCLLETVSANSNEMNLRISDFGLSKHIDDHYQKYEAYSMQTDTKLPVKWLSTEVLETRLFTSYSDVWAFGILLWEMLTRCMAVPYGNINGWNDLMIYLKEGNRLQKPRHCDEKLYQTNAGLPIKKIDQDSLIWSNSLTNIIRT
jgi:hypothetical protein